SHSNFWYERATPIIRYNTLERRKSYVQVRHGGPFTKRVPDRQIDRLIGAWGESSRTKDLVTFRRRHGGFRPYFVPPRRARAPARRRGQSRAPLRRPRRSTARPRARRGRDTTATRVRRAGPRTAPLPPSRDRRGGRRPRRRVFARARRRGPAAP